VEGSCATHGSHVSAATQVTLLHAAWPVVLCPAVMPRVLRHVLRPMACPLAHGMRGPGMTTWFRCNTWPLGVAKNTFVDKLGIHPRIPRIPQVALAAVRDVPSTHAGGQDDVSSKQTPSNDQDLSFHTGRSGRVVEKLPSNTSKRRPSGGGQMTCSHVACSVSCGMSSVLWHACVLWHALCPVGFRRGL